MNRFEHGGDVWHGKPADWMDFSSNINMLGCPGVVRQALIRAIEDTAYYPDVTMQKAVEGLSKLLKMPESCILPTNGGIGALELAIIGMRPKRVVVLTPSFVEYERIALQHDIEFISVGMLEGRHTLKLPMDKLKSELRRGDMLVICNPANPSGFGIDQCTMEDVIELVQHEQATLLVDEAFTLFCNGYSIAETVIENPNVMIAGSLTKIFAIPGVRIGYLLAEPGSVSSLKDNQMPWALSAFASRAAQAAGSTADFIAMTKRAVKAARVTLQTELESMPLFVYESCVNYLLIDLKPTRITAEYLAEELKQNKILIRNCGNYRGLDDYHMRIAVKNDEENEKLVTAIKEILKREERVGK